MDLTYNIHTVYYVGTFDIYHFTEPLYPLQDSMFALHHRL